MPQLKKVRWMTKLQAGLHATAALWVRIETFLDYGPLDFWNMDLVQEPETESEQKLFYTRNPNQNHNKSFLFRNTV